jgi:hypothetical protein
MHAPAGWALRLLRRDAITSLLPIVAGEQGDSLVFGGGASKTNFDYLLSAYLRRWLFAKRYTDAVRHHSGGWLAGGC